MYLKKSYQIVNSNYVDLKVYKLRNLFFSSYKKWFLRFLQMYFA